jgi:hypothetical protein
MIEWYIKKLRLEPKQNHVKKVRDEKHLMCNAFTRHLPNLQNNYNNYA